MFLGANRELVGVRPLHLAFARPLCLLERPLGRFIAFATAKLLASIGSFQGLPAGLQKSFFCPALGAQV